MNHKLPDKIKTILKDDESIKYVTDRVPSVKIRAVIMIYLLLAIFSLVLTYYPFSDGSLYNSLPLGILGTYILILIILWSFATIVSLFIYIQDTRYYMTDQRLIVYSDYQKKILVKPIEYSDITEIRRKRKIFDSKYNAETVIVIYRNADKDLGNDKLRKYGYRVRISTKEADKIESTLREKNRKEI